MWWRIAKMQVSRERLGVGGGVRKNENSFNSMAGGWQMRFGQSRSVCVGASSRRVKWKERLKT